MGVLRNTITDRWHTVCFEPPAEISGRRRSIGHHTEGFATRQEAQAAARYLAATLIANGCATFCECDDRILEWDGVWPVWA